MTTARVFVGGRKLVRAPVLALMCVLLAACSVTWTSPYDQGLVDGITKFHEQAATMLVKLEQEDTACPYDKYADDYGKLLVSLDTLLARASAGAEKIDEIGAKLQSAVNNAVADATGGNRSQFEGLSLTAAQIVDLRNLVLEWQKVHKETSSPPDVWTFRRAKLAEAVTATLAMELAKKQE